MPAVGPPQSWPMSAAIWVYPSARTNPSTYADAIQERVGQKVVIELYGCRCAASVAAQVRRDHMEAGLGKRQQLVSPGIGEFREAVQQDNARPFRCIEAGFENVKLDAIVVVDDA